MLPEYIHQLPTLADALSAMGLKARQGRKCLTCPREVPNSDLVDMTALGQSEPRFVCYVCASDLFRRVKAEQEASVLTSPSWGDNEQANHVRAVRHQKLTMCDWTQMPDATLEPEKRQAWVDYRQALRDLTDSFSSPADVVWPNPPE